MNISNYYGYINRYLIHPDEDEAASKKIKDIIVKNQFIKKIVRKAIAVSQGSLPHRSIYLLAAQFYL
ncbi:hypothetical protein [Dissulfurimicrobium hydrothermale]|uniref:hypothetical protein n=1 Tax=Dissulfurimicrobium hydrothermale TaxID=1750598 RepID=UPI001EDA578A|nr:hypothetical protein [Dissulfurimicrobium hydrothermale]UKL13644.1 hypothetical protein LGS26_09305 [Dissulfurimicrobium hydrothermale]